jgi:hypothetical protein
MDLSEATFLKIVEKRWLLKVLLKPNKSADLRLIQSSSSEFYLFFLILRYHAY